MVSAWQWLGSNSTQFQAISGLLQILAVSILIYTLILAIKQLRTSISQTQGTTISQIAETSRNLFLKAMADKDLEVLFNPAALNPNPQKVDLFIGTLIQHYAHAYHQWDLHNIPDSFWADIKKDAKTFFSCNLVKKKRNEIVENYSSGFASFVDEILDC